MQRVVCPMVLSMGALRAAMRSTVFVTHSLLVAMRAGSGAAERGYQITTDISNKMSAKANAPKK